MRGTRKKRRLLDLAILAASCLWLFIAWYSGLSDWIIQISIIVIILIGGVVIIDLIKQTNHPYDQQVLEEQAATAFSAHELVLLNEEDRAIRAWDLTGRTAMVIGRKNRGEEVDVDLSDCEYSALISVQHAALNYCLDSWYLEDLGSQNGIQLKKVEDGRCYQVASNRPCKISAGDVIYIAKTKLLFT